MSKHNGCHLEILDLFQFINFGCFPWKDGEYQMLSVFILLSLYLFFFSAFDVMEIRLTGGKFLSFQCAFFLVASWELHQDVANSFLSIVQTKSNSFSFLYFSCHCLNRIEKQSRFMSWHFLSLLSDHSSLCLHSEQWSVSVKMFHNAMFFTQLKPVSNNWFIFFMYISFFF